MGWPQCVGPARSTCGVRVNGSSGSEGMRYQYMSLVGPLKLLGTPTPFAV